MVSSDLTQNYAVMGLIVTAITTCVSSTAIQRYPLVGLPCKNGIFSVAFTPFFTAVTPCGPTRCGAASGPRQCPPTVPPRAGAPKRTWDTLEDRVTARVTPVGKLRFLSQNMRLCPTGMDNVILHVSTSYVTLVSTRTRHVSGRVARRVVATHAFSSWDTHVIIHAVHVGTCRIGTSQTHV